ncbi:phage integrase family protein [Mycobacteroides abscessus subsp. abscessus]|uniref:tyrosine-type recombinase/integrase n=1 Tax=Mycobacteroides abscessus TaxID=36809 RepID=UPI0009A65B0C|nr:tyrosine-type recombinase/integrase [Mycobacteroides abscessus]SKF50861.1 phage integrase family protein [Mycobacteroides abscessus subsp. abscessus]
MAAFSAERAISPVDRSAVYVVIDDRYRLHHEATEFLAWLRSLDRSTNTERAYAGRVARYLSYCAANRLEWHRVTIDDLGRFLRSLINEPIPARRQSDNLEPRQFRQHGTANAILTAVCEFLRFCASRGWVSTELVESLTHPKYLRARPEGFDWGEEQQFRRVQARSIRLRSHQVAPEIFDKEQISTVFASIMGVRSLLLCTVLMESGMRIGEALGLHREDMHLLSSSRSLGCSINGPHLHVRRRINANGALAKSRYPRALPVTDRVAGVYADYQIRRAEAPGGAESDFVFVNLDRPPVGAPLKYPNAKEMFERLSGRVGFSVRPHMFRHTAATRWLEAGMPRDVVQSLLGHVSAASMERYFHPSDSTLRDAVDRLGPPER